MVSRLLTLVGVLVGVAAVSFARAAEVVDIVQKGRAFSLQDATIARGSSLRFLNQDDFPHQVHIEGPGFESDSALQSTGDTLTVAFPVTGTFEVTCGIHPRMQMTVNVE